MDGLDFNISGPAPLDSTPTLHEAGMSMDGLSLDLPSVPMLPEFSATNTMAVEPPTVKDPLGDGGMLEFDMDSLSMDLDASSGESLTPAPDTSGEDPLETKLALAEEFVSIGDEDGARALIEEVVAEATGDMRVKAQRALANLS
jgi:pilus assembly protein FimV